MSRTSSTGGFKATAARDGQVIETSEFDHAHEAWEWLTAIRDEQDAAAGLEYTATAKRLHEIKMAVQTLGELTGNGHRLRPGARRGHVRRWRPDPHAASPGRVGLPVQLHRRSPLNPEDDSRGKPR